MYPWKKSKNLYDLFNFLVSFNKNIAMVVIVYGMDLFLTFTFKFCDYHVRYYHHQSIYRQVQILHQW